jgi:hypothetical protein
MGERRGPARQRSFLRGCIYFNNRRSAIDCLIRDVSPAGARLIFSEAVSVPDVFDLYIARKEETLRAHVQRRHGDEAALPSPKASRQPPRRLRSIARSPTASRSWNPRSLHCARCLSA